MGRLAEGWEEFEWRLKDETHDFRRDFETPRWNGEDLAGKRLLVHTEGGYGDALQFIRYVSLLCGRAARLILECQAGLVKLFSDLPGVDEVITHGQALPGIRLSHSNAKSPAAVQDGFDQYSKHRSVSESAAGIPITLAQGAFQRDGRCNVGLASANYKIPPDRRTRNLNILAPLGQAANARLFSLQKGPE